MTSIFDEKAQMASTREIAFYLKGKYDGNTFPDPEVHMDIDEHARCTKLATDWPDTELVRQIIKDAAKVMIEYNISPEDIKW